MNIDTDKITLRIKTPFFFKLKNLIFMAVIIISCAVLFNVFLKKNQQTQTQVAPKDNITHFLENVMIREDGLFTLLGSKPMSTFHITENLNDSEEGILKEYEHVKALLEKCKKEGKPFPLGALPLNDFNSFREQFLIHIKDLQFLYQKRLWENWLQEKKGVSNSLYKFASRDIFGLFINIPNSMYILKKHYEDFSKITGTNFDVYTILDSIEDKESIFWNRVFKNHYLFGLLMGYGQKNAYLFDWASQKSLSLNAVSICRIKELNRMNQKGKVIRKKNVGVCDLEIPYFATFEIDDEDVVRYAREREKIIDFLKDKEFIPFVLNQLGV